MAAYNKGDLVRVIAVHSDFRGETGIVIDVIEPEPALEPKYAEYGYVVQFPGGRIHSSMADWALTKV